MKKRGRCPPALPDALKEIPSPMDRTFVACAARRAFVSFLRGVLREGDRSPRRA